MVDWGPGHKTLKFETDVILVDDEQENPLSFAMIALDGRTDKFPPTASHLQKTVNSDTCEPSTNHYA